MKRGRKKTTRAIITQEVIERVLTVGSITPLEVMVNVMRELYEAAINTDEARLRHERLLMASIAAKDCAQYLHPRINPIDHSALDKSTVDNAVDALEMTEEELLIEAQNRGLPSKIFDGGLKLVT